MNDKTQLHSVLKSGYRDKKGGVKESRLEVQTRLSPDSKELIFKINRSHRNISFALGSLHRIAKDLGDLPMQLGYLAQRGTEISVSTVMHFGRGIPVA